MLEQVGWVERKRNPTRDFKSIVGFRDEILNPLLGFETTFSIPCWVSRLNPTYIYSNPKSFVNFLLPPLNKGRVGVG